MKKIIFCIPDSLLEEINRCTEKWGFMSQAEFLRFAVIDFVRNDGRLLPANDTLKEHTKEIRRVTARRDAITCTKEWRKHGDKTPY